MKTAKIGAIFLVSVLALAGIGAGYAHWTDTITIDGTIETGTLDVVPSFLFDDLDQDKDVAEVSHAISDDTVTVTIKNAYPCLWVNGTFDIKGIGTIPAGLNSWTITVDGVGTWDIYPGIIDPTKPEEEVETALETWVNDQAGGAVTVTVDFDGSNFWQIHDGDNPTMDFSIHFEEALLQDQTFTFSMTLEYWNWNEAESTS